MKSIITLALCLFVMSCAEAGKDGADASTNSPDGGGGFADGGGGGFPDAGSFPDARTFPDAAPFADAPISNGDGGGLFCGSSADCTISGECCFSLGGPGFCVPGTEIIPGVCLPN